MYHHLSDWVDGVQIADLSDSERALGFIAFQVHGITNPAEIGKEVQLRNIELCRL